MSDWDLLSKNGLQTLKSIGAWGLCVDERDGRKYLYGFFRECESNKTELTPEWLRSYADGCNEIAEWLKKLNTKDAA